MLPTDTLSVPGEHAFFFDGLAGKIEAVVTIPQTCAGNFIALLGHPHSLQGGAMTNKVVTTMARAFRDVGIASIRFNFRGVGKSEGSYDAGIGESEDMLTLMHAWLTINPAAQVCFAGFSFGSYVAYRAAAQSKHCLLITIAPPVHHYNYQEFSPMPSPWHIMQGDDDEVVPLQLVLDFASQYLPPLPVTRFANTGHFFHGNLLELKSELIAVINRQVLEA